MNNFAYFQLINPIPWTVWMETNSLLILSQLDMKQVHYQTKLAHNETTSRSRVYIEELNISLIFFYFTAFQKHGTE